MSFEITANSIPEGLLITVSNFDADTDKVVLTMSDNVETGGDSTAFTFTKLRPTSVTSLDFLLTDASGGSNYLIIAEGKTSFGVFVQALSAHATYNGIPGTYSGPDPASLDQSIKYSFTDNYSSKPDDIDFVQFIVSDISSSSVDFSATMNASDVFGYEITIDSSGATSNHSTTPVTVDNVLTPVAFSNGTVYEVAVIYSNSTGAALTTTTQTITPSATANEPSITAADTGSALGATAALMDNNVKLKFTRGAQIQGFPDTKYTIKVTDPSDNEFTKTYSASTVNASGLASIDIDLSNNEAGWTDISGVAGVAVSLSLVNGSSYDFQVSATNESGTGGVESTSDYSGTTSATPSGLPPTYVLTTAAIVADSTDFTLTTGSGTADNTLIVTLDSNTLSHVGQNNGTAITDIVIELRTAATATDADASGGYTSEFETLTLENITVGTYYIRLVVTNDNGSTETDLTEKLISAKPDQVIGTTTLPAIDSHLTLGSTTIDISWNSIGDAGETDWGGYSSSDMSANSGLFGYYVDIYSDSSGNTKVASFTESATATSLSSSSTTNTAFVNGTPLYAKITAFNPDGSGNPSAISLPFAPLTEPTVSDDAGNTLESQSFLNSLVKNTYVATDLSGITLGFDDISFNVTSELTDVSANGGYEINKIYFELVSDASDVTLNSGVIDLSGGDGFGDRTFAGFYNSALQLGTNGYDWELRAYYLNNAYDTFARRTTGPDVTTKVKFSTDNPTVSALDITESDGSCTVSFNKDQAVEDTETTKYVITLSQSRPELLDNSSNIVYSGFSVFSANTITDTSGSSFESTFTGLTNGFNYKASVNTESKEYYGSLESTDASYANYQGALADPSFNETSDDSDTVMPFGPPSITPVLDASGITTGFTVKANGSSLQDAILITPGDNDNIEDITTDMLNSTKINNTLNNGIYYDNTVDTSGGPPFGNYFDEDASGNFADKSFNYIANDVVPDEATGKYFFIVSGQVGHYSVASSDSSFNALFPGTNRST